MVLKAEEINLLKTPSIEIIRYYTREAGVRNLEREIAKICRKVVKNILINPTNPKRDIDKHALKNIWE